MLICLSMAWRVRKEGGLLARCFCSCSYPDRFVSYQAAIRALEIADSSVGLVIHTDSKYVIDGITKWILKVFPPPPLLN